MNRYKLIRLAEYAAVSVSVLGTVAAISTQQPLYAIAPLTVSAALNLLSRRAQEQRLEQYNQQTKNQLTQQLDRLSQQNKLLQQQLTTLEPTAEQVADNQSAIEAAIVTVEALETSLQTLNASVQQRFDETLDQVDQRIAAVAENFQ